MKWTLPLSLLILLGSTLPIECRKNSSSNSSSGAEILVTFAAGVVCLMAGTYLFKLWRGPQEPTPQEVAAENMRLRKSMANCVAQVMSQKKHYPDKYDLDTGLKHCSEHYTTLYT